jgi:AraC-like DNA-binding protein
VSANIRIWRPPGLAGVETKRGFRVTHSHPNHWHDELHMVLIEEGAGVLAYRNNALPTVAGDFFVVPPGEVHANYATVEMGCSFRTVNLRLEGPGSWEGLRGELAALPVRVTQDRTVVKRFRALHRALSGTHSALAAECALLRFLEALCRRCGTLRLRPPKVAQEPAAVRAARDYLNAYLDRNVSLTELAELTQLSPYHLVRVFKKSVGLPPHAYQNGLRVLRSGRLLRQGWKPAAVAATLGFADQAHFTRHFKRVVGLPPQHYQQLSKNVQDALPAPA